MAGTPTPCSLARSMRRARRYRARERPRLSITASSESIHSLVSLGSMSGSWWTNPSISMAFLSGGAAPKARARGGGTATRVPGRARRGPVARASRHRRQPGRLPGQRPGPRVVAPVGGPSVREDDEEVAFPGHEVAVFAALHGREELGPVDDRGV